MSSRSTGTNTAPPLQFLRGDDACNWHDEQMKTSINISMNNQLNLNDEEWNKMAFHLMKIIAYANECPSGVTQEEWERLCLHVLHAMCKTDDPSDFMKILSKKRSGLLRFFSSSAFEDAYASLSEEELKEVKILINAENLSAFHKFVRNGSTDERNIEKEIQEAAQEIPYKEGTPAPRYDPDELRDYDRRRHEYIMMAQSKRGMYREQYILYADMWMRICQQIASLVKVRKMD